MTFLVSYQRDKEIWRCRKLIMVGVYAIHSPGAINSDKLKVVKHESTQEVKTGTKADK